MNKANCPSCGHKIDADSFYCSKCGVKFELFISSGEKADFDPPIEKWKLEMQNHDYSKESLEEVIREAKRRKSRKKRSEFQRKRQIFNLNSLVSRKTLVIFVILIITLTSAIAFAVAKKELPLNRISSYATSSYYRLGYDSVKNLSTAQNKLLENFEKEYGEFLQWQEEVNLEDLFAPSGTVKEVNFSKENCYEFFQFLGTGAALLRLQGDNSFQRIDNTPENRIKFVRGCLDAQRDLDEKK